MQTATVAAANLWAFNPANNNDKVYGLYMVEMTPGRYDVIGLYGRRGAAVHMITLADLAPKQEAQQVFDKNLRTRKSHGYVPIAEDIAEEGYKLRDQKPTVLGWN